MSGFLTILQLMTELFSIYLINPSDPSTVKIIFTYQMFEWDTETGKHNRLFLTKHSFTWTM
jgi:hypothetical protein